MEANQLSAIPETMLITLWAKATETENGGKLIHDEKAVEMIRKIDYDFSKFKKAAMSQVGCCVRASLIDQETLEFLKNHPDAVVIQLGAGIDARYQRLGCPQVGHWYDLDLKEAIDLRKQYLGETEKNTYLSLSMFDYQWVDTVKASGKPILIIIEGVLMYFEPNDVKAFFMELCNRLDGATVLMDMLAYMLVKQERKHDALKKMEKAAKFKWSELHTRDMEAWHTKLHLAKEYFMSDHEQGRFPLWARLMYKIPYFYTHMNQRIVRLEIK
ncbi:class I SAM-dependent methyltransferase [Prevotella sp.]|uniref:class I SAM-dependent methyltransferase n=1 Tax=Prevotella sp. TaxID=59823 RepID=UPI002F954D61